MGLMALTGRQPTPTPLALWTNPGNPATPEAPTELSAGHKFKPQNMTDDIFLAQILGHKLLGPNASFP
jgi:hypothetical protein